MIVRTAGCPMSGGTVMRTASLVKASIGSDARAIKPLQRERHTAAAVAVAVLAVPAFVQTHDRPSVSSALTRERRT
jgi:hypothetical protein